MQPRNLCQTGRTGRDLPVRGNVLFIILIAIGLFAALAATVMNSDGGGKSSANESNELYAADIILFAESLEQGVNRLFTRGISENDLCFDLDGVTGGDVRYETNAACATPANKIFSPLGAGISYVAPSVRFLDSSHSAKRFYGEYLITDETSVTNVPEGSPNQAVELMVLLPYVKRDLCVAINDRLNFWTKGAEPPVDGSQSIEDRDTYRYDGVFNYSRAISNGTNFDRAYRGCYRQLAGQFPDAYIAYFVLRAR